MEILDSEAGRRRDPEILKEFSAIVGTPDADMGERRDPLP